MRFPGTPKALLCGAAAVAFAAGPALARLGDAAAAKSGPQADFPVLVGAPYQIGGVTFVPSDSMNFDSVGYASVGTQGGTMISAAHHTLPVPSYAEVTDLRTGHTILVRIDRRGPMDGTHAIELSPAAAAQLGIATDGKAPVRVRRVNPPEAERGLLRAGEPAPERMETPKPLLDVLIRKLNPALVQRALDSNDQDAGPAAKSAPAALPAPKPIAKPAIKAMPVAEVEVKTSARSKPAVDNAGLSSSPPKGYVPSVPAATSPRQSPTATATPPPHTTGASFAEQAQHPVTSAPAAKPTRHEARALDTNKSTDSFIIQAGAFSEKSRAQAVADKVGGTISAVGKMWRVRTGPYTGHALAEAALAKVKSAGYSSARILRAE